MRRPRRLRQHLGHPALPAATASWRQIGTVMANWGLKHTLVNMQDLDAVERAITPVTRLIWTETPSNPLLNVTDLRAIVALAKKCDALVACDNTWATPLFQQPLHLGVRSEPSWPTGGSNTLWSTCRTSTPWNAPSRPSRASSGRKRPPTRCLTLPTFAPSSRWLKNATPSSPATTPGPPRSSSSHCILASDRNRHGQLGAQTHSGQHAGPRRRGTRHHARHAPHLDGNALQPAA